MQPLTSGVVSVSFWFLISDSSFRNFKTMKNKGLFGIASISVFIFKSPGKGESDQACVMESFWFLKLFVKSLVYLDAFIAFIKE